MTKESTTLIADHRKCVVYLPLGTYDDGADVLNIDPMTTLDSESDIGKRAAEAINRYAERRVRAEREACAKLCDDASKLHLARKIRERSGERR